MGPPGGCSCPRVGHWLLAVFLWALGPFPKPLFMLVAPFNDGDTCSGRLPSRQWRDCSEPGSVGSHMGWEHTEQGSDLLEGVSCCPASQADGSLGRRRGPAAGASRAYADMAGESQEGCWGAREGSRGEGSLGSLREALTLIS